MPSNRIKQLRKMVAHRNHRASVGQRYVVFAALAIGSLVASALFNRSRAKKAEHDNPPIGRFLKVNGVRVHYVERGSGEPLVLLHGNGTMIQDFETSGLIDVASENYRVMVFDRPGFGHSIRPRNVIWTPYAQAELIKGALEQLGASSSVVLGHSWGASVAVAMGLKFPELVRGLILASGYYYPTIRPDVIAMSAPAVPVVGDVIGQTLAPLISRMMWPRMVADLFSPAWVPKKFKRFPKEMALRPSQLRASAEESALMIPDAIHFKNRYRDLKMPVVIIADQQDKLIDTEKQSARLHTEITQSLFHQVPRAGHMIQQTATGQVMSAINEVASAARI